MNAHDPTFTVEWWTFRAKDVTAINCLKDAFFVYVRGVHDPVEFKPDDATEEEVEAEYQAAVTRWRLALGYDEAAVIQQEQSETHSE